MLARRSVRNWSLRTRLLAGVVGLVAIAAVTTGVPAIVQASHGAVSCKSNPSFVVRLPPHN